MATSKEHGRDSLSGAALAISTQRSSLKGSGALLRIGGNIIGGKNLDEQILKEGYVELQRGQGKARRFKRRYVVVYKDGSVELFEKQDRQSKSKESFHLQGGEDLEIRPPHQQRFRFKIIIPEHKNKETKWVFGFSSELQRDEWHAVFEGLLAHLVWSKYINCFLYIF